MGDIRVGHWTKLGSAVRDARTRRGWSQHELANRAGVSRSWLAKLEAGHRGAELEPILRLLTALDMSLALHDDSLAESEGRSSTNRTASPPGHDARRAAATDALIAAAASAATGRRRSWRAAQREPANSGRRAIVDSGAAEV